MKILEVRLSIFPKTIPNKMSLLLLLLKVYFARLYTTSKNIEKEKIPIIHRRLRILDW